MRTVLKKPLLRVSTVIVHNILKNAVKPWIWHLNSKAAILHNYVIHSPPLEHYK